MVYQKEIFLVGEIQLAFFLNGLMISVKSKDAESRTEITIEES